MLARPRTFPHRHASYSRHATTHSTITNKWRLTVIMCLLSLSAFLICVPTLGSKSFASTRSGCFGCCCNTSCDAAEADMDKMRRVDSLLRRCLPIGAVEEETSLDLPALIVSGGFVPEPLSWPKNNGRSFISADAWRFYYFLVFFLRDVCLFVRRWSEQLELSSVCRCWSNPKNRKGAKPPCRPFIPRQTKYHLRKIISKDTFCQRVKNEDFRVPAGARDMSKSTDDFDEIRKHVVMEVQVNSLNFHPWHKRSTVRSAS